MKLFKLRFYFFLFPFLALQELIAQTPASSESYQNIEVSPLYTRDFFYAASFVKDRISNEKSETYIIGQLADFQDESKRLGSIEKIERWLKNNPFDLDAATARFSLLEYYFYAGDSTVVNKHTTYLRSSQLTPEETSTLSFLLGIQALKKDKPDQAIKNFNNVKVISPDLRDDLSYFSALAMLQTGQMENAAMVFKELAEGNSSYKIKSQYYLATTLLKQDKNDEVIGMVSQTLSEEKTEINASIHQLVGIAYANNADIKKAEYFLSSAILLTPANPSADLLYQAGLLKSLNGEPEKAIKLLKEAGLKSGKYADLSAFQLGRIYLKEQKYEAALTSFKAALASTDSSIREESLYQAAKLSAQQGASTEAIQFITDYRESNPDGPWKSELELLLLDLYLNSSNYQLAISQLKALGLKTVKQKKIFQDVTFQAAQLHVKDGDLVKAKKLLIESLKHPFDPDLESNAYYLLGEVYQAEEDYKKSVWAYNKAGSTLEVLYGLGYAYYNLKDYPNSNFVFKKLLAFVPQEPYRSDAYLRYADGLYAVKRYDDAIKNYDQVKLPAYEPYVFLQKGLCNAELGQNELAISALSNVSKDSESYQKAIQKKGKIELKSGAYKAAIQTLSLFLSQFPNSSEIADVRLTRAIAFTNLGRQKEAIKDHIFILDNHLASRVAISAILALQNFEQQGTEITDLSKYIAAYKAANPNDESLEGVAFEGLKNLYFNLNYTKYIIDYQNFTTDYPESEFIIEAQFYLAESYYRNKEFRNAAKVYESLLNVETSYELRVQSRLGELYVKLGRNDDAIETLLEIIDSNPQAKSSYKALLLLSEVYERIALFDELADVCTKALASSYLQENDIPILTMTRARSNYLLGNYEAANRDLEVVAKGKAGIGAEANFLLAEIAYQKANYDQSLEQLFLLTENYGSYESWINKAYLLIAENYIGKQELFQAKATLQSIISHSADPETVLQAQNRLEEIETNTLNDSTSND